MPELPEVETVARDLRPRLVGATIVGCARVVGADAAHARPARLRRGRRRTDGRVGRAARQAAGHRPVGRRRPDDPPQDDRPAVRGPGRHAAGPVRAPRAGARRRSGAALSRYPQVRQGRAVRARPGDRRARGRGRWRRRLRGDRPRAARRRRSPCASSAGGSAGARAGSSRCCSTSRSSPASATSTRTSRCGARACTRCAPRRRCVRPTSGGCTRRSAAVLAEAVERRGSSIDDYTAPDGDGSMQERLDVYQRTGRAVPALRPADQAHRRRRALDALLLVVPAPAGGRPQGRRTILRTLTRRRGSAGPALDRAGGGGEPRADPGRGRARRGPGADRADEAGGGDPASGGSGVGRGRRLMSILRFAGVTREIGTFVILDAIEAAVALGDRIGLVGPNGAGKTTLLRLAAGRDEPDRGTVLRKRGLSIGLLAQESHFDAAFMAAPDLRTAVRTGAAHLDAMADDLAALERDGRVGEAGLRRTSSTSTRSSAATPSTSGSMPRLSGLGFTRDEWVRPPTGLSGGEQTRAALARLVIADPDLLLLDEPTNHLDLDALEWLEDHLRRRTGSLVVASHDRAFLDATVTRVWELRDRRLTAFRGDYSAYHRQREERDARATKDADTQAEPDRARARARPAVSKPPQVLEDARARSAARAAPGGTARGAPDRTPADAPAVRAGRWWTVPLGRDRRSGRGPGDRLPARVEAPSDRTANPRRSRRSSRASRSWPPSAAIGSGSSARTAPARRRSCGRSPATSRRSMAR